MAGWVAVVTFLGAILLSIHVYVWLKYRRVWAIGKYLPGPKIDNLFIGNLFIYSDRRPDKFLPIALELFKRYGPVVRLWVGPVLSVMLKDPADLQAVLGDKDVQNRTNVLMKVVARVVSPGLATLMDENWRSKRRVLSPTFHIKLLRGFVDQFGITARVMTDKLTAVANKEVVELSECLMHELFESLSHTIMGRSESTPLSLKTRFVKEILKTNQLILHLSFNPWYIFLPIWYWMTKEGKQCKEYRKTGSDYANWVLSRKLSEHQEGKQSNKVTAPGEKKVLSFIDAMLEATDNGKPTFTARDIDDEVAHMVAIGTGSTFLALSYTLMLVALYPEVQAKLHNEMDEIFGSDTRHATLEDMQKMEYLDRCIKESLRMFPITALHPRDVPKDITLPSGLVLPAGCNVMHFSFLTHRDPRYFPEPDEFRPDRWLPDNKKHLHPFAYVPFAGGPRECIGKKYAQLLLKSSLSQILRELVVHPVHSMKTIVDNMVFAIISTLNEETGYLLRFTRRKI